MYSPLLQTCEGYYLSLFVKMPGQVFEAPCFKLTMDQWKNFSGFLRELRKSGVFKASVVKFILPDEVILELDEKLTHLGDTENSFYKAISDIPVTSFLEQRVEVKHGFEGVFGIRNEVVEREGVNTVGGFFDYAKKNRDYGTYHGFESPLIGSNFDAAKVLKEMSVDFWENCRNGVSDQKPFMYLPDIDIPPKVGGHEEADLLKVTLNIA